MYSLRFRVLATQATVLLAFFGLTLFGLDVAFRATAEDAMRARMEVELMMLLAESELGDSERDMAPPQSLPEPRFQQAGSGLYGAIWSHDDKLLWSSGSAVGLTLVKPAEAPIGARSLERVTLPDGQEMLQLSMSVRWEDDLEADYHFAVAESLEPYQEQLARWRQQLGIWVGLSLLALILAQLFSLRFLMRPLKRAEREIEQVERGELQRLSDGYPEEIAGLAGNLNTLVSNERTRLSRYRDSLGNLAHSLKTPLAVLRNLLQEVPADQRETMDHQLATMDQLVSYQLRRAAAAGGTTLGAKPVPLAEHLERVLESLRRVYADKAAGMEVTVNCPPGLAFKGDEGDLYEVTGNLLDNAFKYGDGERLEVTAWASEEALVILVEDDGQGIDEAAWEAVQSRGSRLDEMRPGQGIGLSVVREIAEACDGRLSLGGSTLGGAGLTVTLPGRAWQLDERSASPYGQG